MTEPIDRPIDRPRPVFRNIGIVRLLGYRLPLSGKVSILHRISGAFLFFFLPILLYLLNQSLTSEAGFNRLKNAASCLVVKLGILILAWAFLFHFFAGLRHLLMDIHIADTKRAARNTAAAVFALTAVLTLLIACKLFGAF